MSSLFSYDLDEKKIRSTLQNAELEYKDAYWSDFDSAFSERPVKKTSSAPAFIKFNLNINRNILLPIFFIVALAGVSAVMFKFVDLKPDKNNEPEQKALIPNAANYKPEKNVVSNVPKKEIPKQILPPVKKDSVVVSVNTNSAIPTTTLQSQNFTARNQPGNSVQKTDSANAKMATNTSTLSMQNSTLVPVKSTKKRRRNRTSEQIDAIQAPLNLSSNSTPEIEPELKIK